MRTEGLAIDKEVKNTAGNSVSQPSYGIRASGWVASAITILCALVLAIDHAAPMKWLFLGWSVANTLWVLYGWGIRSGSVLSSQLVFCLIDVVGMVHYWIL
ncbi:hypothetical protein [Acidithiobacillus acidisediminis]|uniref:hypothetical protein n=1 Tax=Acidithiobacillus acidisediminis TaxID=2937799 RepID=UPI0020102A89|nr:hypothetical protein [Acidithiobacillus sp. S30A2]